MANNFKKKTDQRELINTAERILSDVSSFNTMEAYKTVRTNIMFSLPKNDRGKVITITSSAPNEGKTTTCINLAITFAQTGAKVLLMDCDLRRARMHQYLSEERGAGVSNILCGFSDISSAVKKSSKENLDILSAGEIPPNPAELLQSQAFVDLINQLSQEYDYVFIDTPPVTVVTDAMIIAEHAMGIVVIVKENSTTFDMLDETMASLKKTQTPILGVIMLSDDNIGRSEYSGKGSYSYKNRYGDDPNIK